MIHVNGETYLVEVDLAVQVDKVLENSKPAEKKLEEDKI